MRRYFFDRHFMDSTHTRAHRTAAVYDIERAQTPWNDGAKLAILAGHWGRPLKGRQQRGGYTFATYRAGRADFYPCSVRISGGFRPKYPSFIAAEVNDSFARLPSTSPVLTTGEPLS